MFIQLNLFVDQISHSSVEFTAYDIFTLNIRLITSVSYILVFNKQIYIYNICMGAQGKNY